MELKGTPNGETAPVEQVKNDAPTVTESNTQEIEILRKRAEQSEMRARQLENQNKEREKKEEETRLKKLEEDNEFKTLYEREKAAREQLEAEREQEELYKTVQKAKSSVLSSYSSEVVELAEATGIGLVDDTEESKEAYKAKLDIIASKLKAPEPTVRGNNTTTGPVNADDSKTLHQRLRYDDRDISKNARKALISKLPELDIMRKHADSRAE